MNHDDKVRLLSDECRDRAYFLNFLYGKYHISNSDAEDAVQDALLKAYRFIDYYDSRRGSVRTWLTEIVDKTAIKLLRKNALYKNAGLDCDLFESRNSKQADSLSELIGKEAYALCVERVERLFPAGRDSFVLRVRDGLCLKEISAVLGIQPGTVGSRLYRARNVVRGFLERYL